MERQAFVLRIAPSGIDRVPEALDRNQLIIGWAEAEGLLDDRLSWEEFRTVISDTYYSDEETLRKAGAAAGHMWRFIREMAAGDLVVVPHGSGFHVVRVSGAALYDQSRVDEDTAYRRGVDWLNKKQAIPRAMARSALVARMKIQGTSARASDVFAEIEECIEVAGSESEPSFLRDLQSRLISETLKEIRSGRMDSFGFERLIGDVLIGLGADEARIIHRSQDKGAYIVAAFRVAGAFRQVVAVQAKHWQPHPPVGKGVVEQLIRGVEAESADLGMVITSGTVSEDASAAANQFFEESGVRIELVDGEQLAGLIVEHGIKTREPGARADGQPATRLARGRA